MQLGPEGRHKGKLIFINHASFLLTLYANMRIILSIKPLKLNDGVHVGIFQGFNIIIFMFMFSLKLEFSDDGYEHEILLPNFPPDMEQFGQ
jgi:hypothetical protein